MPVTQLLLALARDTALDLDLHPGIEGSVTLQARNRPLHELLARIGSAKSYIRSFAAADINDSEERQITFKTGGRECTFRGQDFLCHFVLPNVFFHCTTAYNILRHNGVELGKWDFLGKAPGANIKAGKPAKKPAKKRAPRKA